MNQSHRMGWQGAAELVAYWHPSDRKPCVTPRRVDESESFRATQRALDKPPSVWRKLSFSFSYANAPHKFKAGDRVRTKAGYWRPGLEGVVTNAYYLEDDGVVAVRRDVGDENAYHFLRDIELIPAQPAPTGSGADVFRGLYFDPSNPPNAADGWVKHDGSRQCPIPPNARCQILMAGISSCSRANPGMAWPASDWHWGPVTYYRVVKP